MAAVLVLIGVALGTSMVRASADTQFSVQAVQLSGTHYQPKGNVSGVGTGGFLEIDQRWRSVELHLEGFPSVGTAYVDTEDGPVRASIGFFDASLRFRVDHNGRLWAGMGTEVLAQQTPQAGLSKVDSSRLAGTRYDLMGDFPTAPDHFIETQLAVTPHLSGTVYETVAGPTVAAYTVTGAETASMVDLTAAYGIHRGHFDYLVGARAINFAAKFADGREADRNVGAGLLAQVRVHF